MYLNGRGSLKLKDGQWHDGEPLFMRCTAWKSAAENATESLTKGDRVIVTGRLRQRSFEVNDERRTVTELDIDEIGPSLRYAADKPTKARPGNGGVAGRPIRRRAALLTGTAWPAGRSPAG